jgi:excisionase family DNA binding protein
VKRDDQTSDGARPDFLTARQLASILQVSESTVRRLAREGRIPAVRVTPHLLRFRLDAVVEALDGSRRSRHSSRRDSDNGDDDSQLTFF